MILVTGGAGYIGSHCVKILINKGEEVVVIDNLDKGHIQSVDSRAKFYDGDIRNKVVMDKVFSENDIEGVIHFAAYSLVGESMSDPIKYYDNNVFGTLTLLETMEKHGVRKIVFSSSEAVYGAHKEMPITQDLVKNPTKR